jgi:hypothetical protein
VTTMPPYTMSHSAVEAQLPSLPPASIAAGGIPSLVSALELLHWSCGQDLKLHAHLACAPWGTCLAGCDLPPCATGTTGTQHAADAEQSSAPVRQWARACEDALMDLSHTELELQAPQGQCASLTLPGDVGCLVVHGSGVLPLTLYDIILARHAVNFAAPLFSATASATTNDLFTMTSSLCTGRLMLQLAHAPSAHHALACIRDAVKTVFRSDSIAATFFFSASILHCSSRDRAVEVAADCTGLLCYALESHLPLLVTSPLHDPRYNPALDFSADMLPTVSATSTCSLLIVPCVARAHASSKVLGFIQVARAHAPACELCCFSAVELRCLSKLAETTACLMKLLPHWEQGATSLDASCSTLALSSNSSSRSSDAPSPKATYALRSHAAATIPPQAPLSSTLLHLLSDRRDLALQLFRAASQPHTDARLRHIAGMALAHADAPRASTVQQYAPAAHLLLGMRSNSSLVAESGRRRVSLEV